MLALLRLEVALPERKASSEQVAQTSEDVVEMKEAIQYWGDMFQDNRMASEKLERLLLGIAQYIVSIASP